VAIDEVDPVYFDRTYYLAPAAAEAARRPYVLLLEAMRDAGVAAVGRFVLSGKEKLCLIRPKGDALALETLFVADDVRSQAEIDEAVSVADVKEPELDLARQIISSLQGEFDPAELRSEYREELRELLEAKVRGEELAVPEPMEETPVVDLMDALRRSVAEAKTRSDAEEKPKAASKGGSRTRRTAVKKSA
jgi:DNA end-binding protein Ku